MTTETVSARKFDLGQGENGVLVVRRRKPNDPAQLDAFTDTRSLWIAETVEIAATMPDEFYFSQLKERCGILPVAPNWWGFVAERLKAMGYKRSDTEYRRTKAGNKDFKWRKNA